MTMTMKKAAATIASFSRQGLRVSMASTLVALSLGLTPSVSLAAEDIASLPNQHWVTSETGDGLRVYNRKQQVVAQVKGNYEQLDTRTITADSAILIASNAGKSQVELWRWSQGKLSELAAYPVADSVVEALCLYQAPNSDGIYSFMSTLQKPIEQRLVFDSSKQQAKNIKVRDLPMSWGITSCSVDDQNALLYVAEESVGVWQFDASPEAELARKPVAMLAPFGQLKSEIKDVQVLSDQSVLITQHEVSKVARYRPDTPAKLAWLPTDEATQGETETLQGTWKDQQLQLVFVAQTVPVLRSYEQVKAESITQSKVQQARVQFAKVQASAETQPVQRFGDAADDPAIWLHPTHPEQSLVLGTDKKSGLGVYRFDGKQTQFLPVGRLNNVDLRDGFRINNATVSLAAASHRDNNSIFLFGIDALGTVSALGEVNTTLDDVYGLCMYRSAESNQHYVFINDKDGRYQQYAIASQTTQGNTAVQGELVREFQVKDQPEGCVASDKNGSLYVGVEDHGIWVTSAKADAAATLTEVRTVGGFLQDDVEGLSLYESDNESLLVVSSQGNDSYAVFDAYSPFAYRGSFQVTANHTLGIDGSSETDGLDVSSANFGGVYGAGVLVVQDGRNVMPVEPQNFKLIPFSDVLGVLSRKP